MLKIRTKQIFEVLDNNRKPVIIATLLIALIVRLIIAMLSQGYRNDILLFYFWAEQLYEAGIMNFYQLDIFVDYPPGYLYVLYALGFLLKISEPTYGSPFFLFLMKLPIIILDFIIAWFIYKWSLRKQSFPAALGLMCLFLYNPWSIIDGVVWGQVDALFAFTVVLSFLYFTEQKTIKGSVIYAIAALIKPQAFIFMPVVLIYLYNQRSIKHLLFCMLSGFGSFLLLASPFFVNGEGIRGIISLYTTTLSSYPYAVLNTYNFYALLGLNWVSLQESLLTIPLSLYGNMGILAAIILAFVYGVRNRLSQGYLFYVAAVIIAVVYMFVTKMHERYLFPLMLCLIFLYIYERDRRFIYILLGFSFTSSINLIRVLQYQSNSSLPYDGWFVICSLLNLLLLFFLLFIGWSKPKQSIMLEKAGIKNTLINYVVKDGYALNRVTLKSMFKLEKKDWIIIAIVTCIYLFVAFYNLGSTSAPETEWAPASSSDYVILDLGEPKHIDKIVAFGGVGRGQYKLSLYNQDNKWDYETTVEVDHTFTFALKEFSFSQISQYILLQTSKPGFSIHELAVYEAGNSEKPLHLTINQVSSSESSRGAAEHLIDEQALMQYHHSYLKGSYFDEIYHARTAYEHLHQLTAYETTHPPLGKLLIALGLKLFGFSPFGWRVVGTTIGVLMLPVIYLMGKLLFRKATFAATAMILFAVDFMHFTQTRIATIDVYAVFFIMLMFMFMAAYARMNFYKQRLSYTFIPLGLAGLCFGFGIAAKWISFYGGAGLACMLAIVLIQRFLEYRKAKKQLAAEVVSINKHDLSSDQQSLQHIVQSFIPNTLKTIAICIPFYLIIPALIYWGSYWIALTLSPEGYSWRRFLDTQVYMFSYHSDLVDTHPFASPWYEWPVKFKPIWYFVDNSLAAEGLTSTIAAFGNPLIWWTGLIAIFATIAISIKRREHTVMMIYIGYLSQYVPWMLVTRITFIYHYFAMVPFMILSIVYIFRHLEMTYKWSAKIRYTYTLLAILLFIMFYPVLSGALVSREYVDHWLRWFPTWYF